MSGSRCRETLPSRESPKKQGESVGKTLPIFQDGVKRCRRDQGRSEKKEEKERKPERLQSSQESK